MNTEHYRCLVFDWDGTLIDSIERIVTSLQFASREVCGIHLDENSARRVIGLGLQEAIERLHPELDAVLIESVAAAYRQNFLYDSKVPELLFDGVEELLLQLRAENYALAVATGKSRVGLDRVGQRKQDTLYAGQIVVEGFYFNQRPDTRQQFHFIGRFRQKVFGSRFNTFDSRIHVIQCS